MIEIVHRDYGHRQEENRDSENGGHRETQGYILEEEAGTVQESCSGIDSHRLQYLRSVFSLAGSPFPFGDLSLLEQAVVAGGNPSDGAIVGDDSVDHRQENRRLDPLTDLKEEEEEEEEAGEMMNLYSGGGGGSSGMIPQPLPSDDRRTGLIQAEEHLLVRGDDGNPDMNELILLLLMKQRLEAMRHSVLNQLMAVNGT